MFRVRTILLVGFCLASTLVQAKVKPQKFTLSSPSIKPNSTLSQAQVYNDSGCSGQNQSPALRWTPGPKGTKSYAITVHDPNGRGPIFWHWIAYNIPANVTELVANAGKADDTLLDDLAGEATGDPTSDPAGDTTDAYVNGDISDTATEDTTAVGSSDTLLPPGTVQGSNSYGDDFFDGACPPKNKPHRYIFTVYALKVEKIDDPGSESPEDLIAIIEKNALKHTGFLAKYRR